MIAKGFDKFINGKNNFQGLNYFFYKILFKFLEIKLEGDILIVMIF